MVLVGGLAAARRRHACTPRGGARQAQLGLQCSVVLKRYWLSKSVRSPVFLSFTGCSRADRGLCHFHASAATSPKIFCRRTSLTSPGNGTVSRPVPQTAEYASSESMS